MLTFAVPLTLCFFVVDIVAVDVIVDCISHCVSALFFFFCRLSLILSNGVVNVCGFVVKTSVASQWYVSW